MIIPGVILAGGQSRRMGGGDKTLQKLRGRSLVSHVIARIEPQVAQLALNANGPADRFAAYGLPILPDPVAGSAGPLAGVLAAMDWAKGLGAELVVTVAGDTPFLPGDLVPQLLLTAEGMARPLVMASSLDTLGEPRLHPTCALWSVALRETLQQDLGEGMRKVRTWAELQGQRTVAFPSALGDPFFNVNTPQDLDVAEAMIASAK
ncbi:molybdenum cofactor guanylyltransferase MobA [Pseudooceanicola sediminis]|uniref:Molybdenum cofactor guanylyltransferase n=1 Tax=Pseudooceanicola sediminis TaxID=2211117 RepID=A0A399J277_9RHOB|nr:molybdenum cofactor guanylyltransferase MobA [Pseudooceanicola sediminis]KAA2314599.1 molybdenum cofactor guanylyltransferase MobA [Puniceibacterium sp. HSS470]RII39445.1 molybdenum cofactor guanylyltransferase MobA [Pseudooceanicola sediminis]|tara:strand:- start:30501 stop:31118 length:618 start_codon:yes stop_codon:yes gene_type:complete